MQLERHIKNRIIAAGVIVTIVIIGLVLFLTRPGTLKITSEAGAKISISHERGGGFDEVGMGNAIYKSRKMPRDVFVKVTKDGKTTISGASMDRGKTTELNLKLINKIAASPIFDGSVSDVFLSGTTGQGIVPSQSTMTSFRTDANAVPRAEFIGLPYMKKIIWYDLNNFIYVSFRDGVGRFKDSEDLGSLGIGNYVDGPNSVYDEITKQVELTDVAKYDGKPLVAVSRSHLFIGNEVSNDPYRQQIGFNMGEDLKVIAELKEVNPDSEQYGVFSSKSAIYVLGTEAPAAYASESKGGEDEEPTAGLTKYGYDGKKIADLTIHDHSVNALADLSDLTYVLTDSTLEVFKKNRGISTPLYFEYARDIINYKDRIILLADDGLWQISEDGTSIQLLYEFKQYGVGLKQSLSVTSSGLVFGTQPRPEDSKSNAKTFLANF